MKLKSKLKKKAKIKYKKYFYNFIIIFGILLSIWQIKIYRLTFINPWILITITLICGCLIFIVDLKNYKKIFEYTGFGLYFYAFFHYILGFGLIISSLFCLTNFYLAEENKQNVTLKIIESSYLNGGGRKYRINENKQPYFVISFKKEKKELVFSSKYFEDYDQYNKVELQIHKGFFGFDIIKRKELKK